MTQRILLEQLAQSGAVSGQIIGWDQSLGRFVPVDKPAAGVTAYGDLSGRPTLGTAAAAAASDFLAVGGTAANSTQLGGQAASYYLGAGNLTGTLDAARLNIKGLYAGFSGKPAANQIVAVSRAQYPFTCSNGNSVSQALVAATASTVFIVKKNNVQVGTITFGAGTTLGTAAFTVTTFVKNDLITIHAPATPDATLSDIGWVIGQA